MNLPVYTLTNQLIHLPTGVYILDVPVNTLMSVPKIIFCLENSSVGVEGSLIQTEKTTEYILYTYEIIRRVLVSDTQVPVDECLAPDEQDLPDLVSKFINESFSKYQYLFGRDIISQLKIETSVFRKMDLLAEVILATNDLRKTYLETMDNNLRWAHIVSNLHTISRSSKERKKNHSIVKTKPADPAMPTLEEQIESLLPSLTDQAKYSVSKELERLKTINPTSNEYAMILDYLNWVKDLPWGKYAQTVLDLKDLRASLNVSHYGLADVKDHILEHFCIDTIAGVNTGGVLCFAGEAGTGKTSFAKVIAQVSKRPLIKIALGGVTDEAELRSHRRTYLAARPSRIITGLREAKVNDPVVLFDEIDKLGNTNGNLTGALLEILDPEQNMTFVDRYLEFPVDLSKVLFICTANDPSLIHSALRDRMDIINFPLYTQEERSIIISQYIIPKIITNYKLTTFNIAITPEVISLLSMESQLREIERKLRKLYRKAAVQIYIDTAAACVIDNDFYNNTFNFNFNKKTRIGFS